MGRALLVFSLLLLVTPVCSGQNSPETSKSPKISVDAQRIELQSESGRFGAFLFVAKTNDPLPVVVISHAAIQFSDQTVDLLPLARSLADSKAVVIVLDRGLQWPPKDDSNLAGKEDLLAAERWVIQHFKIDSLRYAFMGTGYFDPESPYPYQVLPQAKEIQRGARGRKMCSVPFGSEGVKANTEALRTSAGQSRVLSFVQKQLELEAVSLSAESGIVKLQ